MLLKKSEIPVESWCPISTKEYPSFVEKVKFIRRHKLAFLKIDGYTKKAILKSDARTFKKIKNAIIQVRLKMIKAFFQMYFIFLIPVGAFSCAYIQDISAKKGEDYNIETLFLSFFGTPLILTIGTISILFFLEYSSNVKGEITKIKWRQPC